jgi:hypothetical protein
VTLGYVASSLLSNSLDIEEYFIAIRCLCFNSINFRRPMWRSGGNTRLLRKRSRVRFPHSANICVHGHVCFVLGLGVFMYNMYIFTKKMYISIY